MSLPCSLAVYQSCNAVALSVFIAPYRFLSIGAVRGDKGQAVRENDRIHTERRGRREVKPMDASIIKRLEQTVNDEAKAEEEKELLKNYTGDIPVHELDKKDKDMLRRGAEIKLFKGEKMYLMHGATCA